MVGNQLQNIMQKQWKIFIKFNENLRKNNDLRFIQVANIDETPLFMKMTSTKTIAKIRSKEVNIKTHGQEEFMLLQYYES